MSASDISPQSPYMKKKKVELIDELKTAENLLLEKHEELITCQDELARIVSEQNQKPIQHIPYDEELVELNQRLRISRNL